MGASGATQEGVSHRLSGGGLRHDAGAFLAVSGAFSALNDALQAAATPTGCTADERKVKSPNSRAEVLVPQLGLN